VLLGHLPGLLRQQGVEAGGVAVANVSLGVLASNGSLPLASQVMSVLLTTSPAPTRISAAAS